MTELLASPAVFLVNGRPCVTSLKIAEHFGKQHQHVLRDIRRMMTEIPEDFGASNFGLSSYVNEQGKEQIMFHVFQDGFVILGMGYTGPRAMKIKLAYIMAFNSMAEALSKKAAPAPAALPAPEPLPDCCAEYRRLREDLDLITGVLRVLIPNLQFHGPRSGSFSQIEIILRVRSRVGDCLAALCEAQEHLREANRLALLIK